jgi:hypothetical protein
VDLTFVQGKLAGVAIPTGDSLSDFAAAQTFVGGAVRLTGTRPDPREQDLLVRVAYVDVPAYRAAGPGVSERDSRRSNSP